MGLESKKRLTISIDKDLVKWVEENIKAKRFATKTHAIEYALSYLRQKSDGISRMKSWTDVCRLNEEGEVCIPFMLSAEDALRRDHPEHARPAAEGKPIDLQGRGFDLTEGHRPKFPYFYFYSDKDIQINLEIDLSQTVAQVTVWGKNEKGHFEQRGAGKYDFVRRHWTGKTGTVLPDAAQNLTDFAEKLSEAARRT